MSIYETLYQLVEQYIFGIVAQGTYQELICILISCVGCLFVFALPFVLVLKVLKVLLG